MAQFASRRGQVRVRLFAFLCSVVCGGFPIDAPSTLSASAPTAVAIDTTSVPSTRLSQDYAVALQASGGSGTFVWAVVSGVLPQGIVLDSASGSLHGKATSSGRFTFVVTAADALDGANSAARTFTLTVLVEAPPSTYVAISDRLTRQKGPLPSLGPAGYAFTDPVFGSRIIRITDGNTRPGALDRSYRTPSSTHANAWSADGNYFYTVSTDGTVIPFAFDHAAAQARRLQPSITGDGGLTLRFFNEPIFSYVTPGVAYGTFNGSGSNLRSVDQFDFASGLYSQLLNLDTLAPNLAGTYTGGLGVSGGAVERLIAFFGGTSQDRHYYLVVFDRSNPADRHLLDTLASTVDGVPTSTALNFKIHAANIDRSGRYVTVYPTSVDLQAPRSAAPAYVWDLNTGNFTALPLIAARTGGHDAFGYGVRVNQDCCTSSTWDAAQWQFRSLATPLTTFDLVAPVLLPKEVYLADHPSWHDAQPDRLVPFVDANYRYGANTTPWRAWDEEIFAVETATPGSPANIWRFAHHRSTVADDIDPSRISFWYTPRVNVSPDGRWALFTSNWEKTLGTDPRGDAGGTYRQDLFLIELKTAPTVQPVSILTTGLPGGTVGQAYSASLQASGGSGGFAWTLSSGSLPAGLVLDGLAGTITGVPLQSGSAAFSVHAADLGDAANAADQPLTITVAPAPPPPVVISTSSLPSGTVSSQYSATLTATGGTGSYDWSLASGALPSGLNLSSSGVLAGTPSVAGTFTFAVTATDSTNPLNRAQQTLVVDVAPAPIAPVVITTTALANATRGAGYAATVTTSGGKAPFTWALVSGSLPSGLSLDTATGTIAGVPTRDGTWNFSLRVTDSQVPATSSKKALTIRVKKPAVH